MITNASLSIIEVISKRNGITFCSNSFKIKPDTNVMVIFIGLIILTQKNKTKKPVDSLQKMQEDQYWAEKNAEVVHVVSSDDDDNQDD